MNDIPATYVIFDLLYLDGHSTLALSYEERRSLLERLELEGPAWRTPTYHRGEGSALLEATIRPIDIVLDRSGDSLRLALWGSPDTLTVQDWYRGSANRVETIQAGDGRRLASTGVDQLIQAMAGFSGSTGLSWSEAVEQRPAEVEAILSAHWQPASI